MTVCLPFSKIRFLTVNPRTGYILFGFIMFIIIYCYQDFYYLNDIGTVPADCRTLLPDGDLGREGSCGDDSNGICDFHGSYHWSMDRDAHHRPKYDYA